MSYRSRNMVFSFSGSGLHRFEHLCSYSLLAPKEFQLLLVVAFHFPNT